MRSSRIARKEQARLTSFLQEHALSRTEDTQRPPERSSGLTGGSAESGPDHQSFWLWGEKHVAASRPGPDSPLGPTVHLLLLGRHTVFQVPHPSFKAAPRVPEDQHPGSSHGDAQAAPVLECPSCGLGGRHGSDADCLAALRAEVDRLKRLASGSRASSRQTRPS